jgi:hypothetical protein
MAPVSYYTTSNLITVQANGEYKIGDHGLFSYKLNISGLLSVQQLGLPDFSAVGYRIHIIVRLNGSILRTLPIYIDNLYAPFELSSMFAADHGELLSISCTADVDSRVQVSFCEVNLIQVRRIE